MTQGTFAHHVHWGYWENPNFAKGTVEDFAIPAEKLSQKVYQPAQIKSGDSILDVGCGFGGTISSINAHIPHFILYHERLQDNIYLIK